jgi:dihydroorotate dehydrogenase
MFFRGKNIVKKFSTTTYTYEPSNLKIGLVIFGNVMGATLAYGYLKDSRAEIYNSVIMPMMHLIEPEDSHRISILLAKYSICPKEQFPVEDKNLNVVLFGKTLDNPIGLAAGYDKNGEAIDALLGFGFGAVEIGSITPKAQKGNPKPRFFRLPKDEAVINRYGFNSQGHAPVSSRLQTRLRNYFTARGLNPIESKPETLSLLPNKFLGINLGKNKYSEPDDHSDYINGVNRLGEYADYIVINISSPNTPGLRALQRREPIEQLLLAAKKARDENVAHHPPLLVKIAPDCTPSELEDIAAVVKSVGIDGVIISNTTISRPIYLKSGMLF